MKKLIKISALAFGLILGATASQAACVIEYKAKRDNPLELYYDVATINAPCASAEEMLRAELAQQGQTLLKVLSKKEK